MAPRLSLLVLLFLLFPEAGNAAAAATSGNAFNVTEILGRFPEFRLLNFLLTKTLLAGEINSRRAVTVLAPDNAAVDWLLRRSARLPRPALVELLSVHVVLDYLDAAKLVALPRGRPTVATTLFQTTGTARRRTGFLSITAAGNGGAVFASAAPGALVNATFKRAVAAKPYNISVLQISNFVVPPGIITRPRRPVPPPPPRMRQMAIAPSPAPVPAQMPTRPSPALTQPVENTTEAPDPAAAPTPSHGHAVQAVADPEINFRLGGITITFLIAPVFAPARYKSKIAIQI